MIEQPYSGKATITDSVAQIEIIIPAKKNFLLLPFLFIWLVVWAFALIMVSRSFFHPVMHSMHPGPPLAFMSIWLTFWTFGGVMAIISMTWSLFGKEIVTVGNGILTVQKKGLPFSKTKSYSLNEINNIYAQESDLDYFRRKNSMMLPYRNTGTIRFDYGLKTIRFADGLDEAEGRHIIGLLKQRKFVKA